MEPGTVSFAHLRARVPVGRRVPEKGGAAGGGTFWSSPGGYLWLDRRHFGSAAMGGGAACTSSSVACTWRHGVIPVHAACGMDKAAGLGRLSLFGREVDTSLQPNGFTRRINALIQDLLTENKQLAMLRR
jgi:hypothetical protein